jgi:ribosomal protein S12 methylthiotransferase accessory factor
MEALERYCASQRRVGALVHAAPAQLDGPAIGPEELVLYSERQYAAAGFPYRPPSSELTWVGGTFADGRAPVYVPAALVYLEYPGEGAAELFAQPTSNGLAGSTSLEGAVLAGLLEVAERDAFLIVWLARLPVPRLDLSRSAGLVEDVRKHYRRSGVELVAFDATLDVGIPVVIAMAVDRTGAHPAVTVGLGCNLDVNVALRRAVMEVVQVRAGRVPHQLARGDETRVTRYEDVRTLDDHAAFAADPDNLHEFDFLLEQDEVHPLPPDTAPARPAAEDLAECCERLRHVGAAPVYVDVTQPDLEQYGLTFVRTLATGLQPMHFGFGEERLGGRRVFTVPRILGYASHDLEEHELNPCPHPLA